MYPVNQTSGVTDSQEVVTPFRDVFDPSFVSTYSGPSSVVGESTSPGPTEKKFSRVYSWSSSPERGVECYLEDLNHGIFRVRDPTRTFETVS